MRRRRLPPFSSTVTIYHISLPILGIAGDHSVVDMVATGPARKFKSNEKPNERPTENQQEAKSSGP